MQKSKDSYVVNDMKKHILLRMATEGTGAGKLRAILDGLESGQTNPDNIVIVDPDAELRAMQGN